MSAPAPARWDRNRILFEIEDDGRQIPCAISMQAIQDASGRRFHDGARLLGCFSAVRPRIESIARSKLRARPHAGDQVLSIWSGDLNG